MELEHATIMGFPIKELARLYIEGALSPLTNARVQGLVYGGEGAGTLKTMLESEITRLRASHATICPDLVPEPTTSPIEQLSIRNAGEKYIAGNPNWSDSMVTAVNGILNDLTFVMGEDRDIRSISHTDLMDFREVMERMPKDRDKSPELKGLSLEKILKVKGKPGYSVTTTKKRMILLSGFFNWLTKHEILPTNPAHDLIRKLKRHQVKSREAFSDVDISVIKSKWLPKVRRKSSEKYWVTLIAMYSGCRLSEAAGLVGADIETVDGIPCMVIRDNEARTVKTDSSQRTIPLHSTVLEAGFLKWVGKKKGKLFPTNAHDVTSKWFNYNCKRDFPNRKVMFHCLRYTVTTELQRAGIPKEMIEAILGHAPQSLAFSVYGKGYTVKQLAESLTRLPY